MKVLLHTFFLIMAQAFCADVTFSRGKLIYLAGSEKSEFYLITRTEVSENSYSAVKHIYTADKNAISVLKQLNTSGPTGTLRIQAGAISDALEVRFEKRKEKLLSFWGRKNSATGHVEIRFTRDDRSVKSTEKIYDAQGALTSRLASVEVRITEEEFERIKSTLKL